MANPEKSRPIKAFQVTAPLFNTMVGILNQLPAQTSRHVLNRIEGGEVTPIFDGSDLAGHRRRDTDPPPPPPPGARATRPTKKRRIARRKGGK